MLTLSLNPASDIDKRVGPHNLVSESTALACSSQDYVQKLTPLCRVLLEKFRVPELVKKFPAFYEIPRFIPALIRA
jgi:hypothetical protein